VDGADGGRGLVAAEPERALAAVRRCAAAGPFFAVSVGDPPAEAVGDPPWQPGTALLGATKELAAAIEDVRAWASGPHPRVAASLFFMSYTGRLLSAAVGGVLLGGVLLDLRAQRLWWRYRPGHGVELRMADAAGWVPPARHEVPEVLLAALAGELVGGQLTGVVRAIRGSVAVSPRVLWGNAASSVAGALGALAGTGASVGAVPEAVCRRAGEVLLGTPWLRGTGEFLPPSRPGDLRFRRRSCCLYYRLAAAGGAKCGDCVLLRLDERAGRWRE
jgi:ferric iron reductase protein FhuF